MHSLHSCFQIKILCVHGLGTITGILMEEGYDLNYLWRSGRIDVTIVALELEVYCRKAIDRARVGGRG